MCSWQLNATCALSSFAFSGRQSCDAWRVSSLTASLSVSIYCNRNRWFRSNDQRQPQSNQCIGRWDGRWQRGGGKAVEKAHQKIKKWIGRSSIHPLVKFHCAALRARPLWVLFSLLWLDGRRFTNFSSRPHRISSSFSRGVHWHFPSLECACAARRACRGFSRALWLLFTFFGLLFLCSVPAVGTAIRSSAM